MKRKNGQALVEFIIILPIFIILLLGIVDFGLIFYNRNLLENSLDEIVEIYDKTGNVSEMEEYLAEDNERASLNLSLDNEYLTVELEKDYEFLTPGLNLIFPSSFKIKAQRVMYNE